MIPIGENPIAARRTAFVMFFDALLGFSGGPLRPAGSALGSESLLDASGLCEVREGLRAVIAADSPVRG
jgi:hypothetical protein